MLAINGGHRCGKIRIAVKARELYDHRQDAAKNVNTAGDDRYAETVSELEKVIKKGWEAAKA